MSSLFLIRMDGGPAVDTSSSQRRFNPGLRRFVPRGWWVCIAVLAVSLAACAGAIVPRIVRQQHKERCSQQLKRLGLAMQAFHEAHGHFPAAAITDKSGTPLLSWRVAILPYLEQGDLYNKFKLDEPWDSPNNKPLLKEMPPLFMCPDRTGAEPFTTTYRGFSGAGALFETDKSITFADVTDGTSNIIAVAESKDAVPWTKPDDMHFDRQAAPSLYGAGSPHPGGFNCGFADGSVRFIKNSIAKIVFQALITRAGGEVIANDAF